MTVKHLIESLKLFQDDTEVKVDVTIYDKNDQQEVQTKRFGVSSVSLLDHAFVISVQCPDDAKWHDGIVQDDADTALAQSNLC